MEQRLILNHQQLSLILKRLAHQLVENHGSFENTALIGLQPRGVLFSRVLLTELKKINQTGELKYGELDTTLYRDDFRRRDEMLIPKENKIDFNVENLKIVLIDDVLYTGRTVRSAMDALNDYGRPKKIELLTLIDRRFDRETPIAPDYVGHVVETRGVNQKVKVEWQLDDYKVWLITNP